MSDPLARIPYVDGVLSAAQVAATSVQSSSGETRTPARTRSTCRR